MAFPPIYPGPGLLGCPSTCHTLRGVRPSFSHFHLGEMIHAWVRHVNGIDIQVTVAPRRSTRQSRSSEITKVTGSFLEHLHDRMIFVLFTVPQTQVFHMLDVMYGISKEFDWHPNINVADNSHDFDVNRSRKLIAKIAGSDGMIDRREFVNLVRKTPALLMRIISAQKTMRDDCVGSGFWRRMEGQRQGMSISKMTTRVERDVPGTLGAIRSGDIGSGGNKTAKKSNSKYAVKQSQRNNSGRSRGKSLLDEEEDRAAMKMQAVMRAKKDRKVVRKRRAEKKAAKEKADLEALLAAAPSAQEAAPPAAASGHNVGHLNSPVPSIQASAGT